MSQCNLDFAHNPIDAFDERRAAEIQARATCEQLVCDDGSSMVSDHARLLVALYLVTGSLGTRMTKVELIKVLNGLAKQVTRDGFVVQHGRIMSLD